MFKFLILFSFNSQNNKITVFLLILFTVRLSFIFSFSATFSLRFLLNTKGLNYLRLEINLTELRSVAVALFSNSFRMFRDLTGSLAYKCSVC